LNLLLVANPAAAEFQSLIALQIFLVVLATQTLALILDARWSTLAARRVATRELERLILKLQVASNLQARRLGHIVHGRVQAQLQAIALQLHGSEPTPEQLTSMAAALEALGSELENDAAAQQSLVASIDAFKNLWDGLCEITVTADDGILEALEADQAKANAALVVIEESITNAVKHASAEQIEVRIDRDGDDFNLIITNDVNRTLKPGSRGFGSKTYAAMTRDWSLDVSETRAILRATL
jgi:two-component sensor histidine kinase